MITFTFPKHHYDAIESQVSLAKALELQSQLNDRHVKFKCFAIKSYIYAKCKYKNCKAELRFKKSQNQDHFKLLKIETHHEHLISKTSNSNIENFIKDLPLTISTQTTKALVQDKFKIAESQFYYLYRKVKNAKISFQDLMKELNSKNYEIRTDPYYENMNELPSLMIIVTQKMKQNFHQFGYWVGFDLTFNMIQQIHQSGQNWKLGCFMGISNAKKIVPYGLVLTVAETKQIYYSIFKSFFEIMKKEPNVIISDESIALIGAIKDLKQDNDFQGKHLLDCFHIMRNIKKNLRQKQNLSLFQDLIYLQTSEQFESKLKQCQQAIDNKQDMELLTNFIQNADKYCFSQIPNIFFGFLPNTSMNEKIHDLIKRILPYSKPFTVVVTRVLEYLQELGDNCSKYKLYTLKAESFFYYPALKQIRFLVCKSIYSRLLHQLTKSIYYQILFSQESFCRIKAGEHQYQILKIENKWICKCTYYDKTGLPCSHVLRLLLIKGLRLMPYIHPHWLLLNSNQNIKRIFQRKTRRNLIK